MWKFGTSGRLLSGTCCGPVTQTSAMGGSGLKGIRPQRLRLIPIVASTPFRTPGHHRASLLQIANHSSYLQIGQLVYEAVKEPFMFGKNLILLSALCLAAVPGAAAAEKPKDGSQDSIKRDSITHGEARLAANPTAIAIVVALTDFTATRATVTLTAAAAAASIADPFPARLPAPRPIATIAMARLITAVTMARPISAAAIMIAGSTTGSDGTDHGSSIGTEELKATPMPR